jgi:hypothetical protein
MSHIKISGWKPLSLSQRNQKCAIAIVIVVGVIVVNPLMLAVVEHVILSAPREPLKHNAIVVKTISPRIGIPVSCKRRVAMAIKQKKKMVSAVGCVFLSSLVYSFRVFWVHWGMDVLIVSAKPT